MKTTSQIIPTILVETVDNYEGALKTISLFSKHIQIDICDGEFTQTKTIGLNDVTIPDGWTADIHLMAKRPSEYLPDILALRPAMIILHAEAEEDISLLIKKLKESNLKVGLALLRETVPESVQDLIKAVDHVMIFAGDLGKMGGKASMIQVDKVRLIKKINPKVEIGWDGGANVDNVFTLMRGGIEYINVGSALAYANDPVAVYKNMMAQISKNAVV